MLLLFNVRLPANVSFSAFAPGLSFAPEASVTLPVTVPLPASVWLALRVKTEDKPDTSRTAPDAREMFVVPDRLAFPINANVPALRVEIPVQAPMKYGPSVTV